MKRSILTIVAAIALMTALHATGTMVDKAKLQEIKAANKVLQNPTLHLVDAIEKPTSYFLKLEARSPRGSQLLTGFLDKQTGELHIGTGYEKDGKPILFPKDAKIIKEGVSFSYGKGSKELYLVTDPECPYCGRFEKEAQGKLDDYRVHVILFPLSFHKNAPAMAEWIMQGKDDAARTERFKQVMLHGSTKYKVLIKDSKKPFVYSSAVRESMDKAGKAFMELGARGTPATFDADFQPLPREVLFGTDKK